MRPVLFEIPFLGLPVFGYGLMLVVACWSAIALARGLARRVGLDGELFVNLGFLALLSGVVGARLSHVVENWDAYTAGTLAENVRRMLDIRNGGLTYYGGFLFATGVLIVYGWRKRIPVRVGMDIVAPCLMVGLGIGRVGCLLNGCCHGDVCAIGPTLTFPYGSSAYVEQWEQRDERHPVHVPRELLRFSNETGETQLAPRDALEHDPVMRAAAVGLRSLPVYPAQTYSTIVALLVAGACVAHFLVPHVPGRTFALMLMMEGGGRYALEQVRVNPAVAGGLSLSMWVGLGLIGAGAVLWFAFGAVGGRVVPEPFVEEEPARGVPVVASPV